MDGTYSYIEKSGNYRTLRQSFSVHKGRHLVKPILFVASNGLILDIHGPYFADGKNNDARILMDQFEKDTNNINNWFKEGDIFLVDLGYRDALPFLENRRYDVKMPPFLEKDESQLTTKEANEARIVTMQRWVVETHNGHLKTIFKFLDGIIARAHVLHLQDFYLIAGALINRYKEKLIMTRKTAALAREIKQRANTVNLLQLRVEQNHLARRSAIWELLDHEHFPEFPKLNKDLLQEFTGCNYQLRLAPSYIQDKFNHESTDVFQLDRNRAEPGLLRFRIFSSFRIATRYQLWILFRVNHNSNNERNTNRQILGYYCTCKSGARTLGCCAHVTSVLWYLGYARHEQIIRYPSRALLNYIMDAANRNVNNDQIVDVEGE